MIIILFLVLVGIKRKCVRDDEFSLFSSADFLPLKGICACLVVMGHLYLYALHDPGRIRFLYPFPYTKVLSNGLFFFFSGYGLAVSSRVKNHYISISSYLKRILSVSIPLYMVYLLYSIYSWLIAENRELFNLVKIGVDIRSFAQWIKLNGQIWFVIELVVLYSLFFVLFRFCKNESKSKLLWIISLVLVLAVTVSGRGIVWFSSTLAFAFGVYVVVSEFSGEGWNIVAVLMVFVPCFAIYSMKAEVGSILTAVLGNVSCILFCIIVIWFLKRYKIGNTVTSFLGNISYEIYLIHVSIYTILKEKIINDLVLILVVFITTILCSIVIKFCADYILRMFRNILDKYL